MNRRGFLASLFGAALAPVAAALNVNGLGAKEMAWHDGAYFRVFPDGATEIIKPLRYDGSYFCLVHPSVESDLRVVTARERWSAAHSAWRADGKPDLLPREILAQYGVCTGN